MHIWEDKATLAEDALHTNRRTWCCRKIKQMSIMMSRKVAIQTLTGYSVIVKGHLIEVWILVTVIVPPMQKIVIQDIFRFSAEVVAHFIDGVDREAI